MIQYLLSTRRDVENYQELLFEVDKIKSVDVYVDTSFTSDWNIYWSQDPSSVFSRTCYLITYAGCPISWQSKIQSEISLSRTESEYISLFYSMREEIPMMTLIGEVRRILFIENEMPKTHCTIFEDNNSCIELVKYLKMRPRTKHIGLKYHHFRSKVRQGMITVNYTNIKDLAADIFTKALLEVQFLYLRKMLNIH